MSKTTNKMITTTSLSLVGSLSLVSLTVLTGIILSSSVVSAEDIVDEINITVPVSCSLSGTGMTSHTATIENGRYVSDIGTTTLKAFCNDNNGFAIYANGYTGDTLGNNKLIGSSTSSEIVTGTATTAGSPDVSNWAMKLETNSSATYALTLDNGFGSYSSVPSSYTKVAHRDSGTDLGTSAEGATLTSTYAAYIAKTQPADSYQGQVIYTLVHPASVEPGQQEVGCEPGKICYQPNANSVQGQITFVNSNLFENLVGQKYDIIVSNPPYIKKNEIKSLNKEVQREPIIALDGGIDGVQIDHADVGV